MADDMADDLDALINDSLQDLENALPSGAETEAAGEAGKPAKDDVDQAIAELPQEEQPSSSAAAEASSAPADMEDPAVLVKALSALMGGGADADLAKDTEVTIRNLKSRGDLNGTNAVVIRKDKKTGRYQVRIKNSEDTFSLKRENLEVVAGDEMAQLQQFMNVLQGGGGAEGDGLNTQLEQLAKDILGKDFFEKVVTEYSGWLSKSGSTLSADDKATHEKAIQTYKDLVQALEEQQKVKDDKLGEEAEKAAQAKVDEKYGLVTDLGALPDDVQKEIMPTFPGVPGAPSNPEDAEEFQQFLGKMGLGGGVEGLEKLGEQLMQNPEETMKKLMAMSEGEPRGFPFAPTQKEQGTPPLVCGGPAAEASRPQVVGLRCSWGHPGACLARSGGSES
eukprot:CAMPEP_0204354304 /NCGR_PEP_ID=MMETSP0469-20131031/33297_1 /ASSEMBLY_ACC=CAM_ASM_000384 /TAXON_ID=2969 /ORGANISM="Oxyrrhis marina" /LENGTH=391 /DNA_ID=CAMNT_0051341355 /DNA_START=1 /DNA_END=1173 /DNA_ORIENTATION=+